MTEKLYIFTLDLGACGCIFTIAKNIDIAFGIMKAKGTYVEDVSMRDVKRHEIIDNFFFEKLGDM